MQRLKYPRTLNEAFGPYARGPIHDPVSDAGHSLLPLVCAVLLVALAFAVALGVA